MDINFHDYPSAAKFLNNLTPDQIPAGFCKCGCGLRTPFPRQNETGRGYSKTKPVDYFPKHNRSSAKGRPFFVIDQTTGCWVWSGKANHDGYGDVRFAGRMFKAHILYFRLKKGDIPAGCELDHLCQNRLCVNPDHLEPVPHSENVRRGRATRLTKSQIEDIRHMYSTGQFGYRKIAKQFGITYPHVARIVKRISWNLAT